MYRNILKKDLKRKKTMNVILLLFVVISTMFIASSVSNIIAAINGTDYFFEKSEIGDIVFFQDGGEDARAELEKALDIDEINEFRIEEFMVINKEGISFSDHDKNDVPNVATLTPIGGIKLNYFDQNDEPITSIEKGTAWMPSFIYDQYGLNVGDKVTFTSGDNKIELELVGKDKDVTFGAQTVGTYRFLLNDEDYDILYSGCTDDKSFGRTVYVYTDETDKVNSVVTEISGVGASLSLAKFKLAYLPDVIVAAMLLVVSIALIMIAVVVLKFTISFTLNEEFREIGVMKAIGIRNNKIRGLYLVKYLALAIIGSIIGFFISIPFGDVLMKGVSQKLVLGNSIGIIVNILSAVIVVFTVFLFGWLCTAKIKRSTPLDAIRSGQTGERFNKKRGFRIGKSPLHATGFIAVNDVASSPKNYITMILAFTLSLVLILVIAITATTMKSDSLIPAMGLVQSDVYIELHSFNGENIDSLDYRAPDGDVKLMEKLSEIEACLAEENIPCDTLLDNFFSFSISYGDKTYAERVLKGFKGVKTTDLIYKQGTAPINSNEIAVSPMVAEKLGVSVGDTVKVKVSPDEERDFIITALWESMNNMGDIVRFSENIELDYSNLANIGILQLRYTDSPDQAEFDARFDKLEKIFGVDRVYTAADFAAEQLGVGNMMDSVKYLVLAVAVIIIILVTVLMERSFITKEKSEIALMKAIGFRNSAVCRIHTLRFTIVALISAILGAALALPLAKLCISPIFAMLGSGEVSFMVDPLEIFAIYPGIIVLATAATAYFTSLYTGTIKASDTSNIE